MADLFQVAGIRVFHLWRSSLLLLGLSLLLALGSQAGQQSPPEGQPAARHNDLGTNQPPGKPAKIKITGYGFLGNRELKRILRTLELGGRKPETLRPAFVEDACLILAARIKRDGYLHPKIRVLLQPTVGDELRTSAEQLLDSPLERSLRFKSVHFQIQKGVRFHYDEISFEGLAPLTRKQALPYFVETGSLFHPNGTRVYTPEGLRRSLANLEETYQRRGYESAHATVVKSVEDHASGGVSVRIRVEPGLRSIVQSVREEFFGPDKAKHDERTINPAKPYSAFWAQDLTLQLKTNEFRQGFPDATVALSTVQRQTNSGRVDLDLNAKIYSGPLVRVGDVLIKGTKRTKPWFVSRRVKITRGELLNPIRAEQGRIRLGRLGAFETVDLSYEPVDAHTRNVVYSVKEGRTLDLSLLFGWGSYEMLRAGIIADAYNVWGLAHHARVKVVQSLKASSGEFTYTIPDVAARDFDLFLHGSGLRREEVSFTREEYGGGIGVHKYLDRFFTDVSLRYDYRILSALSIVPAVASEGLTNPAVGSIIADLKLDRRDNPLYPRRGYKAFLVFETAAQEMGGDANYERIEASASWHARLGGGRYISLGLHHGVALPFGTAANNLPFNRRFFPGGANSIRGYQDGEASPRNERGRIVGAESTLLGTFEFEQALTPKWSLVLFSDNLGIARRVEHYPFDTGLFSVGGGIRWRTMIGPVRLEYGHNLNPRSRDPSGTLQFSLGFPF